MYFRISDIQEIFETDLNPGPNGLGERNIERPTPRTAPKKLPSFRHRCNKTGTKRFVPIEPNLQKWLCPWQKAKGAIIPKNFERRRRYILRGKYQSPAGTLETEWTDLVPNGSEFADISRHSYGSYLDAKTGGDRKTVMHNMGHTNTTTYEQHYKNARTPDQAERFWKISPLMKQRI